MKYAKLYDTKDKYFGAVIINDQQAKYYKSLDHPIIVNSLLTDDEIKNLGLDSYRDNHFRLEVTDFPVNQYGIEMELINEIGQKFTLLYLEYGINHTDARIRAIKKVKVKSVQLFNDAIKIKNSDF